MPDKIDLPMPAESGVSFFLFFIVGNAIIDSLFVFLVLL
jgi:hypothetical protein